MQNDKETVTRHYVVDYLSIANRDIFVTEDGSYTTRYVYDASGKRISAEFDYAEGTQRGEAGENLQSDIAAEIGKVFYRTSILGSTLFAVDNNGEVIAHVIYDPWGKPLTETYTDANYSGLENLNNYTGYTYEHILQMPAQRNLLSLVDVLVDGPYMAAQRSEELLFRGSANQRIIDVQQSLCTGQVVEWKRT